MPTPDLSVLVAPASPSNVVTSILTTLSGLGVQATAWQPLGVARTIISTLSNVVSAYTSVVNQIAQGSYASLAAQMVDANGAPVTTWLDLRGPDQYNETRLPATYAACTSAGFAMSNANAAAYGPYPAGQLHFASAVSGETYANSVAVTVAGGGSSTSPVVTACAIVADSLGSIGTAPANAITIMVTPLIGVTCSNSAALVGNDAETNAAYLARCQAKLGSFSVGGPSGAYIYAAQTLTQPSADGTYTPPFALQGGAITRVSTQSNAALNLAVVTIANSTGTVSGCPGLSITGVTNASNATITCAAHGLVPGQQCIITGLYGSVGLNYNGSASTVWTVTSTLLNSFVINNASAPGAYVSGGTVWGGDLGIAAYVIQAYATPATTNVSIQSAQTIVIPVSGTVYYRAGSGKSPIAVVGAVNTALAQYLSTVPLGGYSDSTPDDNVVPFSALIGSIMSADSAITSVTMTSPVADVSMLVSGQAIGVPVLGSTAALTAVPK